MQPTIESLLKDRLIYNLSNDSRIKDDIKSVYANSVLFVSKGIFEILESTGTYDTLMWDIVLMSSTPDAIQPISKNCSIFTVFIPTPENAERFQEKATMDDDETDIIMMQSIYQDKLAIVYYLNDENIGLQTAKVIKYD